MKNKRLVILLSSFALSLCALQACKKNENTLIQDDDTYIYVDEHNVATTGYEDVHVNPKKTYFQGAHEFKYTESNKPFVKNGVTLYKVVVPDDANSIITLARNEFEKFFKLATDIDIEVISDRGLTFNKDDKYISIGKTNILATSGLRVDYEELTDDGCRIMTKGSVVCIVGGSDYGTLNAVYDFLHIVFRYETYSPDVYEIDRNVKSLPLYNFDVKDIPDIPHRGQNYGFLQPGSGNYDQSNYGYRLRMTKSRGFYFMPVYREFDYGSQSKLSTNTNTWVPFDLHANAHPEWFSDLCETGKEQLCYTAHGDAEELEALIDFVVRKAEFSMKHFPREQYPDMNVITFTMEDNHNTCNCEHCHALEEQYGAKIAPLILFVNEVARRLKVWYELPENSDYYREGFQIIYFAYNAYVDAPVTYNAKTKTYAPSAPEMVLEPNTGVYLAIIDRCDFQFDFFNNPIHNAGVTGDMGTKETIDSWGALTNSIYLWLYQTNFSLYTYFYDSFSFYSQPMYNYIASKGLKLFFAQGQDTRASGSTGTNFNNLKAYLNAKLAWDSTLDQDVLIKRYFKAMYGSAHKEAWNYFGLLRGYNYRMIEDNWDVLVNPRSIYNRIDKRQYHSLAGLLSLIDEIDVAKEIIANDSNYSEQQKKIYSNNLEAEALYPLYATLSLFGDINLNYEDCQSLARRIIKLVEDLRLEGMSTRESGGTSVIDLPNDYL